MTSKKMLWFLAVALVGCYPEGLEYVDEADIVFTNYDNTFDFGTVKTYSMPDRIVEITDATIDDDEEPEYVDDEYADVILTSLDQNLAALGWQKVDKNNNPDVVILPTVNTTTNIYMYYDWWYWGWYYPGYYPGWGWYYPGYYYPPYITGYRSGSLLVQLTRPESTGLKAKIAVPWLAIVNGLLEGGTESINDRIQTTMDQAFIQSPYLKTN